MWAYSLRIRKKGNMTVTKIMAANTDANVNICVLLRMFSPPLLRPRFICQATLHYRRNTARLQVPQPGAFSVPVGVTMMCNKSKK